MNCASGCLEKYKENRDKNNTVSNNLTPNNRKYIFKKSNMYQQIFELHTDILKALSHPKRLEIVHLLRNHSLSVSEIQEMLDLPQANLSQHLQVLRENQIVACLKKGKQIFYRVTNPKLLQACDLIREVLFEQYQDNSHFNQELRTNISDLLPIGIDPVCGMKLTSTTTAFTFYDNGTNYYFCASGCLEKYKVTRHCEERSDEAIPAAEIASLAIGRSQ
ncbi:hypothetical protein COT86_01805 [Candidatus Collierbacteria bacterium CG10_big_fil_rev_8_21_14_0_10_43_36]|uniref:HTH arsR-type domain-containing protein n=4 Tax=Candidatus Collieribacteriota TaxID=1752725 RepID=A0A2H0DTL1_9BACT|nr:MAG: hypothetical protein COW83_03795 [Candidatus Collierbacteria bacterium CG22_combo_CG10-13_8_21_14_all_43_12]PIR99824.1 MAG: hypothetical protein COT86_01805 [Candidatus Collierbacteria bacterium CG10_big_fil_rev_8_21_14_0_10_43_36]PIZ24706.1 MAG: hypothetical protein COY48_01470 [Candidatus Collierbacteria bacterium CG_4_10_14_0_8_um_filter_43_86]PJB47187.1 MAG: hypothetical protein CO104_04235 [Candidatus Collierbacteria bacterium CG_4_9_14_3_um_filter_43_16]